MKNKIVVPIKKIRVHLVAILAVVALYSCIPSRTLKEENASVPDRYQNQTTDTLNSAQLQWKDFFSDTKLSALIDTALIKNQELNIILQQIDMAKNEIKARKGEYLPFVNLQAGAELEKVGKYTRNGAVEEHLDIKEGEEFPEPLSNFGIGAYASWEVDVWKKLRNSKKAAVFEYLSTIEGKNFMVTNLVSEVAESYYELVALDSQLAIIEQNLAIQQNPLTMVKLQKTAARATELAVRRFEAEVLKNQSQKYEIHQQIVETENKINFF